MITMMEKENFFILKNSSYISEEYGVTISYKGTSDKGSHIVIGSDNYQNYEAFLEVGSYKRYPVPCKGFVVSVRLTSFSEAEKDPLTDMMTKEQIGCSISIAPYFYRVACGILGDDPKNTMFSEKKLSKLQEIIEQLKTEIRNNLGGLYEHKSDEFEQLYEILDDVSSHAFHMGKKDWGIYFIVPVQREMDNRSFN